MQCKILLTLQLTELGTTLQHGVDATSLGKTLILPEGIEKFDFVIFQNPLIHPPGKESFAQKKKPNLIVANRLLIRGFLRSAASFISEQGTVPQRET